MACVACLWCDKPMFSSFWPTASKNMQYLKTNLMLHTWINKAMFFSCRARALLENTSEKHTFVHVSDLSCLWGFRSSPDLTRNILCVCKYLILSPALLSCSSSYAPSTFPCVRRRFPSRSARVAACAYLLRGSVSRSCRSLVLCGPSSWTAGLFPPTNDQNHMCMEGSGRRGRTVSRRPANAAAGGGVHGAGRRRGHVCMGETQRAAASYSADTTRGLYRRQSKVFTDVWMAVVGGSLLHSPPRSPSWPS